LGYVRTPPRYEPLYGAVDLLFLCRRHRYFNGDNLFAATIEQMSARDSSNTDEVIGEIFRSMNTKTTDRKKESIRSWADGFPYVNGGLFSGSTLSGKIEVPHFTKIARS